ncbi:Cation channel sperm-associated protein 4 [Folsomia candida]|uniref:Cation channel sperm-associated protein 4 n=1 Tax=Folsomia candida TaxID=158441 RepID=A0A226E300_FOLCA|nr:Cation channel sperm-associated protein 4 [Folsomia candida]
MSKPGNNAVKNKSGSIIDNLHSRKSLREKEQRSRLTKKDRISLENEDGPKAGNFLHYRNKKNKFFYEDIIKGDDNFFHVDVGTECDNYFRGKKVQYKEKKTEIFYHVVDLDAFEYHKIVFHTYLNSVLQSAWFRFLILTLVMMSALMIGLTTYTEFEEYQKWFKIIDQVILSVFIFEIVVKWISLSSLTIVTHTVIKSGKDMGNILLVLIIFMLVMAVMGVILFDLNDLRTQWFLNALNAWYLLFICVTQDGWNSALDEFRSFHDHFALLSIYLILAVSVGAFVFANLIVADGFIINHLDITPTYQLFAKHNLAFLAQRPMKVPTLRHFSLRRLQTYIQLIGALEQNMLEAEIIHLDFEKVMAVILSVVTQLNVYSVPMTQRAKEEGQEVLDNLKRMTLLERENPIDAINELEYAAYAHQFKKRLS